MRRKKQFSKGLQYTEKKYNVIRSNQTKHDSINFFSAIALFQFSVFYVFGENFYFRRFRAQNY